MSTFGWSYIRTNAPWNLREDEDESLEICPNPECNQVEPEWVNGRCETCGEPDPDYDGPPDGAWPGSVDPDEQRHHMDEARKLK